MEVTQVLVGGSALEHAGLVAFYPGVIMQTTNCPAFDNGRIMGNCLFYLPDLDKDTSELQGVTETMISAVSIPTPERAILDNIRHIERFEEGFLCDALERYGWEHREDWSKLEALAEKRGQLEDLHKWIEYAYETSSGGQ